MAAAAGSYSRSIARTVPPSVTVPPMPLLHRSLAVHTTLQGLVLRPYSDAQRGLYSGQAVRIPWRTAKPEALSSWQEEANGDGVVVDGLGGVLPGFQDSYLIVITDSAVAATLPDSQASRINVANSLLAIPLSSLETARAVLEKQAAKSRRRAASVSSVSTVGGGKETSAGHSDDETSSSEDEADAAPIVLPSAGPKGKRPFWQRSFSGRFGKKPAPPPPAVEEVSVVDRPFPSVPTAAETSDSTTPTPSSDDPATSSQPAPADPNAATPPNATDAPALPSVAAAATGGEEAADDAEVRESQRELDRKLVAECLRTMRGLYFSYETDITRSLQAKHEQESDSAIKHLPLWRLADRRFWFNGHLMEPFVQSGLHSYILVLQQGWAQGITVPLPLQPYRTLTSVDPTSPTSVDLDLVIISRRSIERPGLRYQRRGINGSGGVANFVETEFIVSCVRDGTRHVDSFVQIRGSMPLYWSQSPWALKPPPVLERTKEESREAMAKHFDGVEKRYGRIIAINLAEQTGKEGSVSEAYRSGVASLKKEDDELRFVEFDFHRECSGMRYENISKLIDNVKDDLEELQTYWTTSNENYATQNGVVRTNCIDSLDRTNVVQSALSRYVLNRHLVNLGITSGAEAGMHDELDVAFNEIWANNGDAISREYAGTSALKGDFTRTGKRNWRGAMNDANNSVSRLLQSTTSDFFKQAALDYILGVNLNAFQEFAERLETSDPGEILRLAKIRQEAIETSVKEVLGEEENKVAAWTLLGPDQDQVRPARGGKYEEKVTSYTRIPTGDILSLQHGAYILSALDTSTRDEKENYGFTLKYHDAAATEKVHTYSLRTTSPKKARPISTSSLAGLKPLKLPFGLPGASSSASTASTPANPDVPAGAETHYFAFKALRRDAVKISSSSGSSQVLDARGTTDDVEGKTAKDLVLSIVRRIREEAEKHGAVDEGWEIEKDVISLAEAKGQTSIVDRLKNDLYRAIWL
ncbi:hypothetical protein JCM10213v2_001912 [Rhodosporidiobolus nylandii]